MYKRQEEGFKKDTIRRAKKMLGVVSKKMSDDFWTWTLPPLSVPDSSVSTHTTITTDTSYPSNNTNDCKETSPSVPDEWINQDTEVTAVNGRARTPIDARV